MPGLVELAYTTAGGVIGAALTNHLAKTQDRRQLRAAVMRELQRVRAVCDGPLDLVPGAGSGIGPLGAGLTVVMADGTDAEKAHREALSALVVAALSAGIPRRILDFAGGGEERRLKGAIIRLADLRLGGVLGEPGEELMNRCERYRRSSTGLLLRALWHPWWTRLRMRAALRTLRREVEVLHREQEAATAVLTGRTKALAERVHSASREVPSVGDEAR